MKESADLVTLNLDIRQFVQDVIAQSPADLALALWKSLRSLSVLDPTCGSGAFLFAALEILEPLYEGLLERFRTLLADWHTAGEKHPNWQKEFDAILAAVARHPNEAYFIHKTLIVHNLYGVDIMEEAVEICKLRLFLKLAAQLEPGQDIEPLPDIDFNVRPGNTLVGYASRDEIKRAFTEAGGSGQALLQGIETSLDDYTRIMEQAEDADRAFRRFQDLQDTVGQSAADFRKAKEDLEHCLKNLRTELDRFLAGQYDQKLLKSKTAFKKWSDSHQPFHWFVEFYGIMNSGGFEVIVGNPPWLEYNKAKKKYTVRGYSTVPAGNLYALCTERCVQLTGGGAFVSFIVQLPLVCSSRMASLRALLKECSSFFASLTFDDRPGRLFDGLQHCRSTVFISRRSAQESPPLVVSSGYRRWATCTRSELMPTVHFQNSPEESLTIGQFPKFASPSHVSSFSKATSAGHNPLRTYTAAQKSRFFVFYQESAQYWLKATVGLPFYSKNDVVGPPAHGRRFSFKTEADAAVGAAVLNSTFFYLWFVTYGDCFHLSDTLAGNVPIPDELKGDPDLSALGRSLMKNLVSDATTKTISTKDGDKISYHEFRVGLSKPIIDEIDTLLAQRYGFTEEELDFIINYDFKYRMGVGGDAPEGESDD